MVTLDLAKVGRPADVVESTRWLFQYLVILTLLVATPVPLIGGTAASRSLLLAATLVLVGSWSLGYRLRRVPLAMDLLDAVGFAAFALATPRADFVIAAVFSSLWFRTLYGSAWRAALRGLLFWLAIAVAGGPLWRFGLGAGHDVPTDPGLLMGILPSLMLMITVGRTLSNGIANQARAARRDATLVDLGQRLLGLTDRAAIARTAWDAAVELCTALPGVRLLKVTADDEGRLHVAGVAGQFHHLTTELPAGLLASTVPDSADQDSVAWHVPDASVLNQAVGAPLAWWAVDLPDAESRGWLVVGAPRTVPTAAAAAIRGLVNQVTLAFQASHAHRQLAVQARTDTLTGLANRIVFAEALDAELACADRPTVVLFIDIDDFKNVNDGLGHQAGDELLVEIARRLGRETRPQDLVARLGGDEFAVILRHTQRDVATSIATRIVAAIATAMPLSNGVAEVGASVGVATAVPGCQLDDLVRQADIAMYAAKAQGKNRVQDFHPGLLRAERSAAG